MCCFSMPVPYVAGTKIFARSLDDGRQALVYSMAFIADEDLAMILPLPVPPGSAEDAVRFVDLSGYDHFFDDLDRAFPAMMLQTRGGFGAPQSLSQARPKLVVHDVGEYEASFVPSQADFDRLDDRFKLAPEVWAQLPHYADWGFAVFKLKANRTKKGFFARLFGRDGSRGPQKVHPMAFEFPRREPDIVFFPTVHVHDGEVHAEAAFDHQLYCQPGPALTESAWVRSEGPLGKWMKVDRAAGLVDPDAPVFRRTMAGFFVNQDQEVGRPAPEGATSP